MNLVFFLKIFCDLCYYFVFAGFAADSYGQEHLQFPAIAGCAFIAAFCRMLWDHYPQKRRCWLPLLALPAVYLIPATTVGQILLFPAVLYVAWTVVTARLHPNYFDAAYLFRMELKLLLLPMSFLLFRQEFGPPPHATPPYLLAFLLASVLFLRMIRHDERTLRQPKFRLLNVLNLGLVCFVCAFLGSAWFRGLLFTAFKLVWKVVSWPVLMVMLAVGMGIGYVIQLAIPENFHFEPIELFGMLEELTEEEETKEVLEEATQADPEKAMQVLAVIGIIISVLFLIWLFRKLASGRERSAPDQGGIQTRYAAVEMPKGEKALNRLNARTPAQQVRYWYRQFLKKTQQEGGVLEPSMTSRQQTDRAEDVFKRQQDTLARLRALYLPARYKDTATAADAKAAKELVKKLGKE